ncbi:carbohydrate ABC transporter permease [Paenibacillus nasutitermitis]|uniref:Sugar ABC transporter permease n=1 Tax=Paenibacillus nasutitermitis TaxID=1652958 RepID=A0A917E368_9BACL|nr:carbohydrate ABC transporter permease [Paenibacillus nasutitermitis]GGD99097.1 sugar ABC transporter permease [Paenibacillus nasutitermitis]
MGNDATRQNKIVDGLLNVFFIALSILIIAPFVLIISVSLTDESTLMTYGYSFLPKQISSLAYEFLFQTPLVLVRAYSNTFFITIIGTLLSILMTSIIGYAISRRDYSLRSPLTIFVFIPMMFSGGLVPFYILMTQYLHLKNSLWAIILPGLISPFYILIMKGFMGKIPYEIIESAKMDGASEWRIFFRIILPLSTPALATLSLFIAFNYWNEWFNALLFIDDDKLVPLQLLLVRIMNTLDFLRNNSQYIQGLGIDMSQFPNESVRMALVVLVAGPMMFVFPFFQRYFVQGMTVGSLKG